MGCGEGREKASFLKEQEGILPAERKVELA